MAQRLIDPDVLKNALHVPMLMYNGELLISYELLLDIINEQPTIDAVPTEFVMENCDLEPVVCDALTDDGVWCSERCQYSEPQQECIHRYIDRIWRKEHEKTD